MARKPRVYKHTCTLPGCTRGRNSTQVYCQAHILRAKIYGSPTEGRIKGGRLWSISDEEWFFRHVQKDGPIPAACPELGPCWLWIGPNRGRYGGWHPLESENQERQVHRWSLVHHTGEPLAPGVFACHHCDMKPCVNPRHLFRGTVLDNNRDRQQKAQYARGHQHHKASLTEEKVREARRLYAGGMKAAECARMIEASFAATWQALHGRTWTWLE